ncbi:MAG: TRAP transporter small permease [Burkholderiaceae bacterium]|nr:TRAP transporter small permease [Burkholderiaceae bacterium]
MTSGAGTPRTSGSGASPPPTDGAGQPQAGAAVAHPALDRFIHAIEVAAAWFLAVVTALTFVSVILRYFFAWQIPDTYDIGRLLLATLIFWGMAGTGYRGEHITVDLVWGALGRRWQRALDVFASALTLFAMTAFAIMMGSKVLDTRAEHVLTFDLRQPVWIYYALAWLGLVAAVLLLAIRLYRLLLHPLALEVGARASVTTE